MKTILFLSLLFLMISCKKNPVTTTEKKQVTVKVEGKPVIAEASLTSYIDGHSKFSVVSSGKNLMFIQISPIGTIKEFGGEEARLVSCISRQAALCRQQNVCSIVCYGFLGGSNLGCWFGWAIQCAAAK